jgi:hypothetical protein
MVAVVDLVGKYRSAILKIGTSPWIDGSAFLCGINLHALHRD